MKLSALKRDHRLALGAWVNDIPDMPGLRLKVESIDGFTARKAQASAVRDIPLGRRVAALSPEDADLVETEVLLAILHDWDGLDEDDGSAIAYSPTKARELLTDPDFEPLRSAVRMAAAIVKEVGKLSTEDAVKN